jgi:hypothetical protein
MKWIAPAKYHTYYKMDSMRVEIHKFLHRQYNIYHIFIYFAFYYLVIENKYLLILYNLL